MMSQDVPKPMPFLPSLALAFLATVFGLSTSSTLGELSGKRFPSPAVDVGALANSPIGVVLATCIPHDDSSPILDVGRKLLHVGIGS